MILDLLERTLALETSSRGLVAHGMQGFDYKNARNNLDIPNDFDVMAMIAIGKKGSKENLSPNLQEIVMEGNFKRK